MSSILLPKASTEFSSVSYWQDFFSKRKEAFEWYGEYSDLCDILHKFCKTSDNILVPGCGNSKLSEDLYDVGHHSIVNVDISELVIRSMASRNEKLRSNMKYITMDIKKMTFVDGEFDVILDKGTLDAIFTSNESSIVADARKYLQEVCRVLSVGGRFICVTLAQHHIIEELLDFFVDLFCVRIHCIEQESINKNHGGIGSRLPVFVFVLTKMKMKLSTPILEVSIHNLELKNRMATTCDILKIVKDLQDYAMVQNNLAKSHLDDILSVDLWNQAESTSKEPRYTLTVVECTSKAVNGLYAVFIVPQGREKEWLFVSDEGRRELCNIAGFKRLAIATLHRGHVYESIEQIKEELSIKVMDLAPPGLSVNKKVPFLTAGEDVGYRHIQFEGRTAMSGDVVIEDVQKTDKTYARQLIFRSMPNIVQSEARLVNDPSKNQKKKKNKQRIVDTSYLLWDIYKSMMVAFAFLPNFTLQSSGHCLDMLLIGVGGGCLPSFISKTFSQIKMTCLELDSEMLSLAKTWFAFQQSPLLQCIAKDGLKFMEEQIQKEMENVYDVIVFDVGCSEKGRIIVPPDSFIQQETLENTKKLLKTSGVLCINTNKEKSDQHNGMIRDIKKVFPYMYQCRLPNEANVPLICLNAGVKQDILSTDTFQQKVGAIQKYAVGKHNGRLNNSNFGLLSYIECLSKV